MGADTVTEYLAMFVESVGEGEHDRPVRRLPSPDPWRKGTRQPERRKGIAPEHSSTLFRCKLPDRRGEGGGIFLGQGMADVRNDAMLAPADELCGR